MQLPATRVLCTIGTPCTVSAVGTTETHRALVTRSRSAMAFAAFDAGLVDVDVAGSTAAEPRFVRREASRQGEAISVDEIDATWGERLRASMGIRRLSRERMAPHIATDIAAPLPHDLEEGGLRRLAGLTFSDIRHSPLMDLFGLFDDDPRLAPSLQAQLFLYGGLGALAALPRPLSGMLSNPERFRVVSASAFQGAESFANMSLGMQPKRETVPDKKNDKLAYRLASTLNSHGPALISTMLSPVFNLSRVRRSPELLEHLRQPGSVLRRVPQAPLVTAAACASALVTFCDAASSALFEYPGHPATDVLLWTAADAALLPDARILEAFGVGAMMSREKLDVMNAGREPGSERTVAQSLAPFDVDAQGTVVGHAGSGVVVTTLDFALRNGLDVSSIIVGWGQSGETGGKGHFAGVGFGGENATILALQMAQAAHGYGVTDFEHLVAHATGTRTNSRTDLAATHAARRAAAELQGLSTRLPTMTVGAPKAVGDGHSMGETGLKAVSEAIHYLLGGQSVGIPTLRRVDDELGEPAEYFRLSSEPVNGRVDGGVLVPTQGFGGYNGAIALRGATPDALRRYGIEPGVLEAYLERWPEARRERVEREARWRRTRGFVRLLAEEHRWPGV
jgi:3-oxoacyl-[acyl-carrier-protein] synthase II